MVAPLMPKGTAVWLIDNTTLDFAQIAEFCELHPLEIQGIADGDVGGNIIGEDPIQAGILTKENLEACQEDSSKKLIMRDSYKSYVLQQQKKKSRYTPIARRQDKPDAIAWLVKNYPDLSDGKIGKLVGTTKKTISAIRDRSHWNMQNINPRDPVLLGLCTQTELQKAIDKLESAKKAAS